MVSSSTLTIVLVLVSRSVWNVALCILNSYLHFQHIQCFHSKRMELNLFSSDIFTSSYIFLFCSGQIVTTLSTRKLISCCSYISCNNPIKRHHFCQNIPWLMTGQIVLVLAPRCSYLIRDYPVTQHFKLYFLFLAH